MMPQFEMQARHDVHELDLVSRVRLVAFDQIVHGKRQTPVQQRRRLRPMLS